MTERVRDFMMPLDAYQVSPGARKEQLREREFALSKPKRLARPYVELHAASAFSFLRGASLPEDLVEQAVALQLPAMALVDRNGVYGAPRFHKAARAAELRALVGAEVTLEHGTIVSMTPDPIDAPRLTLLVRSRVGYQNLCRLITRGALRHGKGATAVNYEDVHAHADGLHCLTGGDEGALARALNDGGIPHARRLLERLMEMFPGCVHVELQRHHLRCEEHRNQALLELARALALPVVATNGVCYAKRSDKALADVLTSIRHGVPLDAARSLLDANRERHLKDARAMSALFADLPHALDASVALARELDFTLADLGYRFPSYPVPAGETPISYLRAITARGASERFQPITIRARAQLEKELGVIDQLDLAGYFLVVWDIVQFCLREKIMVQGRGSAANSAVCYALSITAVDPVKMELLFERFLSAERGEWPDIDLDLPSGEKRERVIQHVYQKYGVHGAAMTANVITYREKSAAREVGKALGYATEQVDRLSQQLSHWNFGAIDAANASLSDPIKAAGIDPDEARAQHFARMFLAIQNLPRHLGQHSGGMVVAGGRLDEIVPLEPASMPGRVVVQWDKDDCADLGLIKVDLLGLGMLAALEQAVIMVREHEGKTVDLAQLPKHDERVFRMLRAADTVGVFQVESRAQMASLPRHEPRTFYDLVVQVAIIRPGPIVGGMLKIFFERRRGRAPIEYAHPCLEPILKRTLGVPLFQEQLLRMAMAVAGFTGGEAEELRRAMGFKRSVQRMQGIEDKLRAGMAARGMVGATQDQIVKSITSFALYGFPESHAASFALIAYASAYLKVWHAPAFYASILNAWPMGFYHPSTLVKDAQRHDVQVLPIDVTCSPWLCRLEGRGFRLGLRFVKGLRAEAGERIAAQAARAPFRDVADFARRCRLREDEITMLAEVGALATLGLTRRAAIWQVAKLSQPAGPLFDQAPSDTVSPLPEMTAQEQTVADYRGTEITTGPHIMAYWRSALKARGCLSMQELERVRAGRTVRTAGAVIVRQRPGTAKGFVFLTLEDETGMQQAIIEPKLFQEHRSVIVGSPGLVIEGTLQRLDGTLSLKAKRFWPLADIEAVPSHDFC